MDYCFNEYSECFLIQQAKHYCDEEMISLHQYMSGCLHNDNIFVTPSTGVHFVKMGVMGFGSFSWHVSAECDMSMSMTWFRPIMTSSWSHKGCKNYICQLGSRREGDLMRLVSIT